MWQHVLCVVKSISGQQVFTQFVRQSAGRWPQNACPALECYAEMIIAYLVCLMRKREDPEKVQVPQPSSRLVKA